jgi:hypothetical protein
MEAGRLRWHSEAMMKARAHFDFKLWTGVRALTFLSQSRGEKRKDEPDSTLSEHVTSPKRREMLKMQRNEKQENNRNGRVRSQTELVPLG